MGAAEEENGEGEQEVREEYANKCELMLSLVGYAVGLGNLWRFPALTYENGGGAFLIPYFCALLIVGLPLFILELGLGQIFRAGTLQVWEKMGMPRLQGVGMGATVCTWLVCLYYNIILSWSMYYMGRTLFAIASGSVPWTDELESYRCPSTTLAIKEADYSNTFLFNNLTGTFNATFRQEDTFWCPSKGESYQQIPEGYKLKEVKPAYCPAEAAVTFWENEVLRMSSGMNDLGAIHPGSFLAYTAAWLMVYFIIFKGVGSSGKVVYVTAVLPYIVLVLFFFRAITLDNMEAGILFYVKPDFSVLKNPLVWMRALNQIFYSLGVGFGSLVAFGSYAAKDDDFVGNAVKVSVVNCGTSVFAGFVVFPTLGYLALEMSKVNPCITKDGIRDLESIGLSGTSLAFVAFPIAISKMPFPFFWAALFFVLLLCLGVDSQFAMMESVMTVIKDAGIGQGLPKPALAAIVCGISYILGLIFITEGGVYWFNLFDYYTCAVALFFVTAFECFGLMWADSSMFEEFKQKVFENTNGQVKIPAILGFLWKWIDPAVLAVVIILVAIDDPDLMGAEESKPYPEGNGYLPPWSIHVGWVLALLPLAAVLLVHVCAGPSCKTANNDEETEDDDDEDEKLVE